MEVGGSSEKRQQKKGSAEPQISLDETISHIGFGPYQVIVFLLAGLTTFSYGAESAVFSLIADSLNSQWGVNGVKLAIFLSISGAGNATGGVFYGYLCDNYGRVWPYVLAMLSVALFILASAFSPNYETLLSLRFCVSIGIPGSLVTVISALTEVLPVRNRGQVLVLIMLVHSVGICVTGGLAWWLIPSYPTNGWRYLIIATAVPPFLAVVFRIAFPFESPRYLLSIGDHKRAHRILQHMACFNRRDLPFELEVVEAIQSTTKPSLKESFLKLSHVFKRIYLRTTISMGIIGIAHAAAYNSLGIYIPTILGYLVKNSYFTAFIGYLGQIPGVLLMAIIVEWKYVGRLNSMRFFVCLAIATLILFATVQNSVSIPILTIFINFSTVPLTGLMLSYISEYYPTPIRGSALAFFNNLAALFGIFFPYLGGYTTDVFDQFPWLFPSIWALFYLLVFFMSCFLQRETHMLDLSDHE